MTFRDLLEKYVSGNRSKEIELMARGYMPLTPSIMKDFEHFIPKTYHVTSFKNVDNIMKLQGKRKDIPTFTKGSYGLSRGAIENSDVLFTLEGYSSFDASLDFESVLDRNGHRWLNPDKDYDMVVNNKFKVPMYKEIIKEYDLKDRFSIESFIFNLDNKEKAKFIKFYFDTSKKLTTKTLINDIKKSISNGMAGSFGNNEILLHNFKVNKLQIIIDDADEEYELAKEYEEKMIELKKYSKVRCNDYIIREDIEKIKE